MEDNYETIELTKPKRGRPKREAPPAVPVEQSVITTPTPQPTPISNPVEEVKPVETKRPRGRPKRTPIEEVKPVVQEVVKPVVEPVVQKKTVRKPKVKEVQEQPVIEPVKPIKSRAKSAPPDVKKPTTIEDDEDYKTFGEIVALLESTKPIEKKTTTKSRKQPPKQVEIDDVEYRIDMVKQQIADKKIKKTKKENDYLKRKLAELEQELLDLASSSEDDEEPIVPQRKSKSKPIKIPRDNILAQPQVMTRTEVMRSFGF